MRGSCEFGRQRDARGERRERDEGAAVQRQLHDLLVLDDGPEAGRLGAQDRRVRRDRDLFAHVADGEVEVDPRLLAGRQPDAVAPHRLEPGQLDVDAVVARRQARRGVDALAARHDDALPVGVDVGDGDGRARHGGAGLILDDAGDFTGGDLGESGRPGAATHHSARKTMQTEQTSAPAIRTPADFISDVTNIQIDLNRFESIDG